ncbi:LPXTG cell wall anchor domain-containing protein [Autumnicola musiva]|uniref:LPXTG cell wall anchor domain-containing protein n=1 Tax=Autumnicola musiva TaxID=3075589 RepID=A0ABU3D3U6_9FLAO|nr:LPXTG cell wall anchor domain-containing protein [Zunongwangia sp. F117]MDT0675693.1 LPXTG cell wall anchor domain-containing protein [Zunongwangia sp. F117]
MKNVLKVVLLLIGIGLIAYGLYALINPEFAINSGPVKVEGQGDNTQSYAMIGFGILSLIAGLAFRKR